MKKVYVAPNPVDASLMHDLLQRKGIRSTVHGLSLFSGRGELPLTDDTLPSVWVNENDFERARLLIEKAQRKNHTATKAKWTCSECDEENPISFEICWKCRNDRANSDSFSIAGPAGEPDQVGGQRRRRTLLLLLCLIGVPVLGLSVFFGLRFLMPEGPPRQLSIQANQFLWGEANQSAVEFMQRGHYEEAIGQLADIRDQGRDNVFTYMLEGFLHAKIYHYDEALESLTQAISLEPDYYRGYLLRANVLAEISQHRKAQADLQKAAELIPIDQEIGLVWRDQAEIALKLGLVDKAQAIIDKAYRSKATISSQHQGMLQELQADIASQNGAAKKAVQHLQKAIDLGGQTDTLLAKLGRAYLDAGQLELALSHFNQALALNVRNAEALAGRAAVSRARDDCTNALTDLTHAVVLNGQNPSYYFDRAKCHFIGDDIEQANADFRRAIDLNAGYDALRSAFIRNEQKRKSSDP